jgi:hypothetical protein
MSTENERLAVIESVTSSTKDDVSDLKAMMTFYMSEMERMKVESAKNNAEIRADLRLLKYAVGALVTVAFGGGSTLASVLLGGGA